MKPRSKASKRSKATRSKDSQDVEMASIDDTTTDDQRDGDQPAVSNRRGSVVQAATTGRSPEFVLPDYSRNYRFTLTQYSNSIPHWK